MQLKTLQTQDLSNKIVLIRTDFNVPLSDGAVSDDFRIISSLPTIQFCLDHQVAKIVLISHLGRPDGRPDAELSLRPVADRLKTLLPDTHIEFVPATFGDAVKSAVLNSPAKSIILLENLRFDPREEQNSVDFAQDIVTSTGADLFVQDGFAVVHRAHASTAAITKLLPSVAGLLLKNEIDNLSSVKNHPEHPLLVLIGGSKVADKQPLIDNFLPIADQIFIGGKIAADGFTSDSPKITVAHDFFMDELGQKLDIGPESTIQLLESLKTAKSVIWNGVFGKTEDPTFTKSSIAITEFLGKSSGIHTIICGGDTVGFIRELQKQQPDLHFDLLSTGGGASLEFLSGLELPGISALLR